jgi:type II secretory pathway component PulJ
MEEMLPNCTFAKSEKRLRHIETNSTTFGRLKEMARFQLSIRGDLELWLVYEDGYASPMNLGLMEPISKLITKDSTLQVEKLDGHDNQELLYPSEQTYLPSGSGPSFASFPRLPSNTDDSKGSELDDEEFARLLSMEPEDMNSNRHKHRAFKMLGQNASPPHPGEIIARASCSQFAIEGGQSACTSICLYAASQLLERINETPSCITTDILDVYLQYGSMIFRNLNLQRGDHTSVDDLWNHLLYSEIVRPLQRGDVISGTTSHSSFQECLGAALSYAHWQEKQSVALVVTKPPETILLVCKEANLCAPWFLFDSHGSTFEDPKRAYVMQCGSMETAAAALVQKFPSVKGLGDSLHAQQMNMFEAHAIVFKPVVEGGKSRHLEPCKDDAPKCEFGASLQAPPQAQPPILQDHLRDSITGELFADPVFCDKGHTHERSSIERHFHARREMRAEEEERFRQTEGDAVIPGERCGAGRNFEPTCPLTGEPISEILISNDNLDRMVQLLVECGHLTLDDDELEDWRERRKEKTRLAQERRAQADSQALVQDTKQGSSPQVSQPLAMVNINADTVLVHGKTDNHEGHFCLGVSVALCPSDWDRTASNSVPIPRCSNSCCRTRLQTSNQDSCARCARMLCSTCLVFHVTEADQRYSDALDDEGRHHAICPECALQISHALSIRSATEADSDEFLRKEEEIDETMEQFFASLMNQKAELQHLVLHYRVHKSFQKDAHVLNQRIEELRRTRTTLEQDIRQAEEKVKAAKIDDDEFESEKGLAALHSPTPDELRLQTTISALHAELNTIDWTTEEGIIRGSLLEHQHNEAILDLGVAQSLKTHTADVNEKPPKLSEKTELINALESRWSAVAAEHDALIDKGPSNEHDYEFTVRVSELTHMYDQLSTELIQAKEELEKALEKSLADGTSTSCDDKSENEKSDLFPNAIASSLMQFMVKPFARIKLESSSSTRASSTVHSETGCNLRDDVESALAGPMEELMDLIVPTLNETTVEIAIVDLAAIGVIGIEEVMDLPLGLRYPSVRTRHQVLVLRNHLELARVESERALDEYYGGLRQQLQARVEGLEDELVTMRREVASAQAIAEEEERLRQERMARRAAAEMERQRLEEERAVQAQRLRQEQEKLEAVRREQEEETRRSLRGLDLRRCGNPVCGFGPFEKFACNDMGAHNDVFTFIDANGRRQNRRRNECPLCQWTNKDWNAWPKFDA